MTRLSVLDVDGQVRQCPTEKGQTGQQETNEGCIEEALAASMPSRSTPSSGTLPVQGNVDQVKVPYVRSRRDPAVEDLDHPMKALDSITERLDIALILNSNHIITYLARALLHTPPTAVLY
jgi:hypothetical protein